MHSDDHLTEFGMVVSHCDYKRILIIACGALAREILTLIELNNWKHMALTCLPAKYHLYPEKITSAVVVSLFDFDIMTL